MISKEPTGLTCPTVIRERLVVGHNCFLSIENPSNGRVKGDRELLPQRAA